MGITVDLTGRRVLVTGASSGIGAATCRSIVGCGGSVAMLARRKERLDQLRGELGERAVAIRCDVAELEMLVDAVDEAARFLGGLDAVIAVAGRGMVGTIATGTPQRWRDLVNLNLIPSPPCATRLAPGRSHPCRGLGIYAATKRGLRAAFDTLRIELAPSGVNVSFVMPGMFDTEGLTAEAAGVDGDLPETQIPIFVPGSRLGAPAVLADTIAFMIGLLEGTCVNELVARPTGQINP